MEVSKVMFYNSSLGDGVSIEIPKTCPNCGIGNNPTTTFLSKVDDKADVVFSLFHRCIACQKFHMTTQLKIGDTKESTMISLYPDQVIENIDPLLLEHAPNFSVIYSEAVQAEKASLINIAGMGYRLAIESLIKDYALDFELESSDKIAKLSFNNCIDKFMKEDELLKQSIHTVRKIGNDYSHWKKEYDLPLPTLKAYVDITVQCFKMKFMMKYPPL